MRPRSGQTDISEKQRQHIVFRRGEFKEPAADIRSSDEEHGTYSLKILRRLLVSSPGLLAEAAVDLGVGGDRTKMLRSKAEQILSRILEQIERGDVPLKIRECYVFGSFAAGVSAPGDLDLILIHDPVIHEGHWRTAPRPSSILGKGIRKPGERIDILTGTSLKEVTQMYGMALSSSITLLWSEENRDWRTNLTGIPIDPKAGRFERNHFADLKRFNGSVREMEKISEALKLEFLNLDRIDIWDKEIHLNPQYRHWFEHWEKISIFGRDTLRTLESAMWWLQQQRGQSENRPHPYRCEISSADDKYKVLLGRPHLWKICALLISAGPTRRLGLIPHFNRDYSKEILVFERGKKWDLRRAAQFSEDFDLRALGFF